MYQGGSQLIIIEDQSKLTALKTSTMNERQCNRRHLSYIKQALAILRLLNPTTQQREFLDAIETHVDQMLYR